MPPVRRAPSRYRNAFDPLTHPDDIIALRVQKNRTTPGLRNLSLTATELNQVRMAEAICDELQFNSSLFLPLSLSFLLASFNLGVAPRDENKNEIESFERIMHILGIAFLTSHWKSEMELDICVNSILLLRAITALDIRNSSTRVDSIKSIRMPVLDDNQLYRRTRFDHAEFQKLMLHLRIPEYVRTRDRRVWSGELVLFVSLYKLTSCASWDAISEECCGKRNPHFLYMFHWFVDHVYETFYHKISGDSLQREWAGQLDFFREIIWSKMHQFPSAIEIWLEGSEQPHNDYFSNIPFDMWRIFGFVDDHNVPTQRPGAGPRGDVDRAPRRWGAYWLQRSFWSGYFRKHGLKFMSVLLPNGMFTCIYTASHMENDVGVLNMSGLATYMMEIFQFLPGTNVFPCLFGDRIFKECATVTSHSFLSIEMRYRLHPNGIIRTILRRLNSLRQCIELEYGAMSQLFKMMDDPRQYSILRDGGRMASRIPMVCFFLKNCHNCFRGSPTTTVFNTAPPTIEEYLPIDENIPRYVDF